MVDYEILKRGKYTKSLTILSISERDRICIMAFHFTQTPLKAVLLIDDVLTARSTVEESAQQFLEGGSRWAGVASLATPKKKKIFR